jgi:hypothetical protein
MFKKWKLEKPYSLSLDDWNIWHTENKKKYPIRYFLQETLVDFYSIRILRPLQDAKWWVYYRTTRRYNVIKIKTLKPGYYDKDTQMLHACFQLLTDFVEKELAGMHLHTSRYKVRSEQGPAAGLAYLDWEINAPETQGTGQEIVAKEKRELYLWWVVSRPSRIDPWTDPSIWGTSPDFRIDGEINDEWRRVSDKAAALEQTYTDEDDAMLLRLITIKNNLWS